MVVYRQRFVACFIDSVLWLALPFKGDWGRAGSQGGKLEEVGSRGWVEGCRQDSSEGRQRGTVRLVTFIQCRFGILFCEYQ